MLFPLTDYTRHRSQTVQDGSISFYNTNSVVDGIYGDPQRIVSVTPSSGTRRCGGGSEMHDVETPQWRKLMSRGIATVNPMEQASTFYYPAAGNYAVHRLRNRGDGTYEGFHAVGTNTLGDYLKDDGTITSRGFSYPAIPDVDTGIIAEAIQQAWANVSVTEQMILASTAEMGKTIAFLISLFRRAWKIFRALRRGEIAVLKGELKPSELRSRYLEARYALRPLAYDIIGVANALRDGIIPKMKTYRAFRRDYVQVDQQDVVLYMLEGNFSLRGSTNASRQLDVRSGVLTEILSFTNLALKFGTGDILQSIWEIVPFSFIVDWFFSVGRFIASWSPKCGFKTLASWYVVQDTICLSSTSETGLSYTSSYYNAVDTVSWTGTYSKSIRYKYRIPNPDRPLLPSWNLRVNSLKLLDLGAIAWAIGENILSKGKVKPRPRQNPGYAWFDSDNTLLR